MTGFGLLIWLLANNAAFKSAHSWHNSIQEREWNKGFEPTIGFRKLPNRGLMIVALANGDLIILPAIEQEWALKYIGQKVFTNPSIMA